MKKTLIILLIPPFLISCSNNKEPAGESIIGNAPIPQKDVPFPHYKNVYKMLEESYDYRPYNGSLVLLSRPDQREHVQVSKQFLKTESSKEMAEQVKRDIVYVAFQAFALTDINELTITSVPLETSNDTLKRNYFNEFRKTLTVNRNTAKLILRKYFENDSFTNLFYLDKEYYLPSKHFDLLKFAELENVYLALKN